LRVAAFRNLPVIFTYHTRYELYGHYALQDSPMMMRLALSLALGYCDLCDAVVAPSESTAEFLVQHKIKPPVHVIPTGIKASAYATGNGPALRKTMDIPQKAFIVGHVGRLAPEKNLRYLSESVVAFLKSNPNAHFLVAGSGATEPQIRDMFAKAGLEKRLHLAGVLEGTPLADIYAAMDVFAFSSHSETQGLVLAEAMTASVPVVSLDAPGAREIVKDGHNGYLLPSDAAPAEFAMALALVANCNQMDYKKMRTAAADTSRNYTHDSCITLTLALYSLVLAPQPNSRKSAAGSWEAAMRSLGREWDIFGNVAHAVSDAVLAPTSKNRSEE